MRAGYSGLGKGGARAGGVQLDFSLSSLKTLLEFSTMNVSLFPEVNKVTGTNHQSSPMQKMLLRGNKLGRESFPARSCQQTSVPEEEPFLSYREVGSF